MKRLHVHVSVDDLDCSISFYSALFAAEPTIMKPDYAKWMLDDPRMNFAISARGSKAGLDHLGIQVEDRPELAEVYERLTRARGPVLDEGMTTCCYAKSEKRWIADPQGVAWETFLTTGENTVYGADAALEEASVCCEPNETFNSPGKVETSACCAPSVKTAPGQQDKATCCAPAARATMVASSTSRT